MTKFEDLPNEILTIIIEDDDLSIDDHLALTVTSKRLNAVVTPKLYASFYPPESDNVDDCSQKCIRKFQQFCSAIRQHQFYANKVQSVELPGTILSQITLQDLLTCPGLVDVDLELRECVPQTLKTFAAILKSNVSSPVESITYLRLESSLEHEWVTKADVIDLLSRITTTLPKLTYLQLPDFQAAGSPETGEILKALRSSDSLKTLYLWNPSVCSAIIPDNQLTSLSEILFAYDWEDDQFLAMIAKHEDYLARGWVSMMKRRVNCCLALSWTRPYQFAYLARHAIQYSERAKLESHDLLRYLIASNPVIYTESLSLLDLTSSERDIVLATLLDYRPSEFDKWSGLSFSLYSTDIPSIPLPRSLKKLLLQVKENLSPDFIPTLLKPVQCLQCLEILFDFRSGDDGIVDENGMPVKLVATCTHNSFKLPRSIIEYGYFSEVTEGIYIERRDGKTIWTNEFEAHGITYKFQENGVEDCDWFEEMRGWVQDRPSFEFVVGLWPVT